MSNDVELVLAVKASLENILRLTYTFPEFIKLVETDMFYVATSANQINFWFTVNPNLFCDTLVLSVKLKTRSMELRYPTRSRYLFRSFPEYNCVANLLKLHIEAAYVIFRIENYIKECVNNQNQI